MHPEEARPTLAQFRFHIRPIAHNILRFAVLAVILALSAVVVAGCGIFDPKKGGGIPPDPLPEYVVPSQPEYVLTNLETAYSHRDSVGCKALYDPNYVGTSEDLNDPPGTVPAAFTYRDEVDHVAALRRSPTISSVSFSLGPTTSWTRLPSNDSGHPDWAVIQIAGSNLDIQVQDGENTWQASGTYEFFEFAFQPTTPAPSSPSDTLWEIVKWRETRSVIPGT